MNDLTSDSLVLPVWKENKPILVAISGGVDSVVLAHLLYHSGIPIQLAHVNYGLRGDESQKDERFVADFASKHGISLHVLNAAPQRTSSGSVQTWAREVRYTWFGELCESLGITSVAVGHHMDDQLETMLLNLLRGTGLAGLSGMKASRPLGFHCQLIRPLLSISRAEILNYAAVHGLVWREDSSNKDGRYARNQLRKELSEMAPHDYSAFLEAGIMLQKRVVQIRQAIVVHCFGAPKQVEGTDFLVPASRLSEHVLSLDFLSSYPAWARGWMILEIVQRMDPEAPRRASVIKRVNRLATAPAGRTATFGTVKVWKEREALRFLGTNVDVDATPKETPIPVILLPDESFMTLVEDGEVYGSIAEVSFENIAKNRSKEAFLDADKLLFPLMLRRWKPGDRFTPFGMTGSQKLKSFLTNQKVPSSNRKDIRVLLSGGQIVWIVGHRIDNRYKIDSQTSRVVHVKWRSKVSEEKAKDIR